MESLAGGSADLPEVRLDSTRRESCADPPHFVRGSLTKKAKGPNSGPLRGTAVRARSTIRRHPSPASLIVSKLPADVLATLYVLIDIELSRREAVGSKAKSSIDVLGRSGDDAVLK